jgi:hypothetical protein
MSDEINSWSGRKILDQVVASQIVAELDRIAAASSAASPSPDAARRELENLLASRVSGDAAPVVVQLVNLYISMLG